ncbi:hypothetical protein B2G71_00125 [Novosphingobium sp. PC22D]|uniref:hypothetical protein n=1 Tax=Novosphingobium sp. PC22D TaxID=1962403 RepID=UPI000BF141BD|nr:hypothetical protein [Novosphingobium sp. PC22D]PEQ14076.1 hypothetical protein B2G71_00125 [Novosphingobium sp. PC22D]
MPWLIRVALTPSAVFLSVLFGGAFGSGREVVQFMTRHGPAGGFVSMAVIAAVYAICLALSFELARLYRTYEYRGFFRLLLGRGWVVYEVVITLTVITALAICASSSGAVLNSRFGLPSLAGGVILLLLVVALNYGGREMVERSMVYSVAALAAILAVLLAIVLGSHGAGLERAFDCGSSFPGAFGDGLKYAITNTGFIPLLLFCGSHLQTRAETMTAGLIAGLVGMAPAVCFHLTFLVGYPQVLGEALPTYFMIEALTSPEFLDAYVLVLFIMIAQTGVGVLHGAIERIDTWMQQRTGAPMNKRGHAVLAGAALVSSTALASVGLVDLIAQAYAYLSILFALIYVVPLLTIGTIRILKAPDRQYASP